ncbi:homoserine O-acetyltransferase MetX [Aneurinibacillus migulanus]|uniref:Homoserine O-acetyltransferase n=2 Tax=Aneurinibacillus migulanus TaxID=47500 RepID=A0A0K2WAL5_ANEMI|nr:homoserine O-acetyltransferase [Aneurinibacillus migulanus]MCP1355231.1 homoserine O-acetyltransferase [Aneurinibacillus migulanus]MED0892035.1 homoserine O-acetyltransferase [Aneurinibacillus migulanus]MED1618327.1 homoserine O-acetyltransferase [Aneurinibacillus migulanus]MED4730061.1 homoserine O-acetyltransferase [Aneurinibacillus migulanus]CEH28336.1 Homoserine O-acetyltransferase (Hom oserine O-trans-acetylase) [Aneurinibacillus migulanus]
MEAGDNRADKDEEGVSKRMVRNMIVDEITLECGDTLKQVNIAFETSGTLNEEKTNAILVCHALTGDACAVGDENTPGWWEGLIGPGRYIDTNKYFVVTANVLGGCCGTTGPASVHPETGKPYGSDFPVVTIRDMVQLQYKLVKGLGIEKLFAIVGGSMGGMQVYEWAVMYPEMMHLVLPIATSARLSAVAIAYNDVGRQAILSDPEWNKGHYYPGKGPVNGLSIARMLGMITYRTSDLFEYRFGRRLKDEQNVTQFDCTFNIESYLRYQGQKLVSRFDANSYLYLLKAMDLHDIGRGRGGIKAALDKVQAKVLSVAISNDLLYPADHQEEVVEMLRAMGKEVEYHFVESIYGHDGFLVEFVKIGPLVKQFIEKHASLCSHSTAPR